MAANVIRLNAQPILRPCDDCGALTSRGATAAGRCCIDCAKARRLARYIRKNHKRRAPQRITDITTQYERALRKTTRHCPLCGVRMTNSAGHPNSKHLDHIIPLVIGGTHTVGNVRVICRTCNLTRPKDGSDLDGHQPTLWAQDLAAVPIAVRGTQPRRRCGECGETLRSGRCWRCRPSRARHRIAAEVGRSAASMRAKGMTWQGISDRLGLGGPGTAYQVARRDGDDADIAAWPARSDRQAA